MSGTIPAAAPGTGMISPGVPFVAQDLTPTPLSFRFLAELWRDIGSAQQGVTDGSNAAAGQIGEYLTATASGGLTSGTPTDIVTLTLSAGDWDVAGSAVISPSAATMTQAEAWLSTVANTSQNPGTLFVSGGPFATIAGAVGPVRYSVTAPATQVVHLGCEANFPGGTAVTAQAWIRARRTR